jgi:hypothetical protein
VKVPSDEGLASHIGPESCAVAREGGGEALIGRGMGRVLSRERIEERDADAVEIAEGHTDATVRARSRRAPRGLRPRARRVVRSIQKWLSAGVLEDGKRTRSEQGTVQGGSISPLLANIYLHDVFDLWVQQWRNRQAHGDVVVVRYADDFVVGFEHQQAADGFVSELKQRFADFGLALHPDKTRLIEFGRLATAKHCPPYRRGPRHWAACWPLDVVCRGRSSRSS